MKNKQSERESELNIVRYRTWETAYIGFKKTVKEVR
jgi:hypothetical protein